MKKEEKDCVKRTYKAQVTDEEIMQFIDNTIYDPDIIALQFFGKSIRGELLKDEIKLSVIHKAFGEEWKQMKWYKKGTILNRSKNEICVKYEIKSRRNPCEMRYDYTVTTWWKPFNEEEWKIL